MIYLSVPKICKSCKLRCKKKVGNGGGVGSCVFCAPLDQCIGRYINPHSTDMSVDISTDTRPICRSTYRPTLGRYIDQDMAVDLSTDILVDISTESVCPIVGGHVDQ